ncbi:MAG: Cohesin domain [Candidatus Saccharibacteria bacterium]|jgi:hypothetical protein|nr:Cohesin domain [Candidatus Saccharibacteria bacterium]
MIKPLLKAATFDRPGLNALVVVIAITVAATVGYFGYQYTFAAAGARMYLSPSKANATPGGTVVVDVRANSGGTAVNAAQVNVSYPTDLLQYEGYDAQGGAFEVQAAVDDEPGVVRIARGTTTPVTGDIKLVSLRFSTKANGRASLKIQPSSALVRTSDATDSLVRYGSGTVTIKP